MTHDLRFTKEKIGKRLDLIRPKVHRARLPIAPFRHLRLPDAEAEPPLGQDASGWPEIPWDSYWAGQNENFMLRSEFTVRAGWADGALALHLPMGEAGDIFTHPESLVYIDGTTWASADRYHHTVHLDPALADGKPHRLELHGWTGLTDWPPDFSDPSRLLLRQCHIVDLDEVLNEFLVVAETALDVVGQIDPHRPEYARILTVLDEAFLRLDTRDPLETALHDSAPEALQHLKSGLRQAGTALDVTLHAIGHAHMDIAYLWPVSQIRRKNARTYSNVLRLMERFPDYRFSHSQPQLYEYVRQDYPEIFEAIKESVSEGRWEVMGGLWVEPDTNIPGGESLVRQITLGRNFFREHFGDVETPVLWLPDVFGLSWCLPQLLKLAGLQWVVSNKFSWNQYNRMPATTTWWQGIDGTRVLTHFLTTPRTVQHLPFPTNYKSDLSAKEVIGTWKCSTEKQSVSDLPIAFGYGDGGGGPTATLIQRAAAYEDMPAAPRVRFSTVREVFEAIEASGPSLPVWNDEFYLEGHRGVLTSQGWIKRANRKAEVALHEAEFLAALSVAAGNGDAAADERTQAWKLVCLNQFHDVLPGTSVTEVFDDAKRDFEQIEDLVSAANKAAISKLGFRPSEVKAHIASSLPFRANRQIYLPDDRFSEVHLDGVVQPVEGGRLVQMNDVEPYSLTSVRSDRPNSSVGVRQSAGQIALENAALQVTLSASGELLSVFDKSADREVLAPGEIGNVLQAFEDRPISWDAWDIDAFFEDRCEVIDDLSRLTIAESGPLRCAVKLERSYRQSAIVQWIRLSADSRRIDFHTQIDWRETHALLKVAFPVAILNTVATYEIQWGSIERPTHRNTSWDFAKFEVPAQKWADLSEGDYGVALLNDCKYGYDIRNNVMRLSLIKSATMPDPSADQGFHEFTYSLFPHQGDWRGGVIQEAYDLNIGATVLACEASTAAAAAPLVSTDCQNIVIETVKPAEDGEGFIVRLFESQRSRGAVRLRFGCELASLLRCNLLEENAETLQIVGREAEFHIDPFEIVNLRCVPG